MNMRETIYFVDSEHAANWAKLVSQFEAHDDPEYKCACYVLAVPEIYRKFGGETGQYPFTWTSGKDYDGEDEHSQAFYALSGAYRRLVRMAMNLFNERHPFNLCDALGTWGDECFRIYHQAVKIRINRSVSGVHY